MSKKQKSKTSRGNDKLDVKRAIDMLLSDYFDNLNGQKPRNIHKLIIGYVEHRLIENTLQRTNANRSKAAEILGLNRSTLRTKLEKYKIPPKPRKKSGRSAQRHD